MLYSCFILLGHQEIKPGIDEHEQTFMQRQKSVSSDSLPVRCQVPVHVSAPSHSCHRYWLNHLQGLVQDENEGPLVQNVRISGRCHQIIKSGLFQTCILVQSQSLELVSNYLVLKMNISSFLSLYKMTSKDHSYNNKEKRVLNYCRDF